MTGMNTRSYQMCLESFNLMALDQPTSDRYGYRAAAMEAVTGPDAGMVMDRLYKSVMSRASINFGKIPESAGNLTKFTKYKGLADTLTLLDRQLGEYNVKELKLAHDLHDNLIRCRDDFAYGFKTDSQFLKTTYNTMVYSLCELLNLCDTIYVDALKAAAEGRPFEPEDFSGLLLVQNIQRFVTMVQSGEWSQMMLTIRKDAKNLINIIYNDNGDGSMMHSMAGIVGTASIPAVAYAALKKPAEAAAVARGASKANLSDFVTAGKGLGRAIWAKPAGKIAIVVVSIMSVLLLIRGLIMIFYRGAYKLNDILEDNEKFLKAHIDNYTASSGNSRALSLQTGALNTLTALQSTIRSRILKADAEGKKMMRESNVKDFSKDAFSSDAQSPESADDDIDLG